MSETEQIDNDLAALEEQIRPLLERQYHLRRKRDRLLSAAFIRANDVCLENVELSTGDGKPWFGEGGDFAKWMKRYSSRRFCEWNGRIYFTAEIVSGRMDPYAPATVDDLKPAEVTDE